MCLSLIPSVAFATIAEGENYLQIKGIAEFEDTKFDSFAKAYETIKPKMEELCDLIEKGTTAEAFDAMFTDSDKNGNATITYTIHGTLTYDETSCDHLLTMGRKASHYGNGRHLINFKFVGANNNRTDTLVVDSNITLPYEWWGEKTVTAISFEGLTLTGSAPSGIYASQPYFEGIDFKIDNCTLKGIKVYNCSNVGGSYTITNSTFDGTGTAEKAYAIHLQGNDTAPLSINISDNIISGYDRGINIDQATAVAVITGNTISVKENGRSCIQFTQLAKATASGNTLNLNGGNAFTFYSKLAAGSVINITGNIITGNGYLAYDDTKNSINLTYSGNSVASTVDTTKGIYGGTTKDLSSAISDVINSKSNFVAKIGDTEYKTLAEAIAAASDGETVTLLADCSGDGIVVAANKYPTGITIDFANYSYTVGGKLVGSTGTASNGFQLLAGNKITMKNGFIYGDASVAGDDITEWSGAPAIMIQNYSNLTLDNMTVSGGKQTVYTISNNNGNTVIKDSIINAGNADGISMYPFAFDVCRYSSYPSVSVTVEGNSVINGNIEISGGIGEGQSRQLNIKNGTFNGKFSVESNVPANIAISGGKFAYEINPDYCADGFIPTTNEDGTYGVKSGKYVAEVNSVKYETLQAAIDAAGKSQTVTLVSDTKENVTIAKQLTLDLNGYTLNGGTEKGKAALTITARGVTVKDSSTAQTGTIMREDTAENSGISSHYVIDVQGGAWVFFEGGNVKNNSGNSEGKGASLVRIGDDGVDKYPGLNIKGGTFTQDNFIAIKVDRGDLFLNGGTINSANSYAIENWLRATVKGGTVNGTVSSWVYSTGAAFSNLEISGGKVNGNVASVNYDDAADKQARIFITGGEITGTLGIYTYNNGLNPITDNTKAAIEVTGGTFTNDPTAYLVEDSSINKENGKYSVAKAYLAKVGDTQYYTMDEAFKAQTASGKDIVLLRDYKTTGTFKSGSIKRTVDLNGHTWTYTGTAVNCAAFEINYSDVMLTVKNGTVISNSMIGLIPSAMSGTITYDNSALIFEDVKMAANGHSGIETNGNNTNDTVTLKNSTLNVPNGFGIYFPSSGTLNIENSAITAKTMGVQVCSGSLNISVDSVINVTGDPVEKTENDGAIQDGAAVSVVNRPGYKGLGKVTITGGTFKSAKGEALKAYKWENKTESEFGKSNVITVSGGTFSSAVPADYCADGFIPKNNGDGTYTVKEGAYVAEVGGVKYETVNAAIAAAKDGDTVTLLGDTTEDVLINKSITLDLGGKTLTNTGVGKATISITGNDVTVKNGNVIGGASYYNIEVKTGASATLEGVTATAGNTGSSMVDNWGTLTINSGTYTGGLDTVKSEEGSKLTITGGKFTLNYAKKWAYNAVILVYGDTTISGGEFIQNAKTSSAYPQVVMTGVVEGYDAITRITGGTFTNNFSGTRSEIFWALGKATSDNFEVSGGSFNKKISDGYCADGYIPTKNTDGTYGVKEGSYVAQIGTKKYETLADAIRLAAKGKTITLLKDITVIGSTTTVPAGKTITIDLNGFTLNGTNTSINAQALLVKGNLTLTDSVGTGKICSSYTGTSGRVISVEENGTLIINSVTVTTEGMAKAGNAIYVGGNAKLVLNSGTVKADCKRGNYAIRIMSTTAAFEMNGGEIIAEGSDSETYITALGGNPNSSIAITGGKITAPKANAILARSSNITITGGEFSGIIEVKNGSISGGKYDRKVTTKYCAAGLYSEIGTDGLYEIVASEKLETGVTVKKKLTLGNDLTMTYRVISDGFDASYIVFSFENYSLKKYEDTTVSPTKNADGSFSFVFKGINPQRMNDILKATVYLEKDGKLYEYAVSDYSVKAYCLSILNNPAYGGRYNEIISNLLKYGEEAQKYTGYRSDDIVTKYFENTPYSPVSHTDKIDSVPTYNETKSVDGGITITTKKLLLDNAVKLRVYFTLDDNVSINQVKFAAKVINNGETIRTASFNYKNFVKDSENNRYYFEFSGIMATELDNMLVFTSTVNNVENDSLTYNVNNYLANHASDSDIGALIQALFNYGYTCDNF